MHIYIKKFDIRWSDIDANRHLANASYMQYASHTRLSFLADNGFTQVEFEKYKVGPAALHEQFFYFREVHLSDTIYVRLELMGISEDGSYFYFRQRMYNQHGKNVAYCTVKGAWMDLVQRRICSPPDILRDCLKQMPKTDDFAYISQSDVRSAEVFPEHMDSGLLGTVIDD